jgi:hypothetical protein
MLQFKEIMYNSLKIGTRYIILQQIENKKKFENKIYVGIFNGVSEKYPDEISSWKKTYISYSNNSNKKIYEGDIELNKYTVKRKYMELNPQKEIIQNNMEFRALNIILRAIIGDNNFCY